MYPVKRPKSRIWFRIVGITVGILVILLAGTLLAHWEFSLSVKTRGSRELTLDYGEVYTDPGASALLTGQHLFTQGIDPGIPIHTEGTVDTGTVGSYTLTYATLFGGRICDSRQVTVVDRKPPSITLRGNETAVAESGLPYEEEGFLAYDEYDGDLTDKVIRTEENGQIVYTVTDSSGNAAQVRRTLEYTDTLPPEITLVGDSEINLILGSAYGEPGYSAWDHGDGDLTEQVTVTGHVDLYTPGTYQVCYSVCDSCGHRSQVTRTVNITAAQPPEQIIPTGKVIYLTFDDGPSIHTPRLLEILAKYNVKATFFVVGNNPEMMRRIVEAGHTIAIHSVTHNYRRIYASQEAYFADLRQMQQNIFEATGVKTTLIRFPGGSSNTVSCFNDGVMTALTQAVEAQGFVYFDWNVDSNDAGGATDRQTVYNNVIRGILRQDVSIVLQHDTQGFSVEAVEDIIQWGLANGYTFLPLEETSPNCHHQVNN